MIEYEDDDEGAPGAPAWMATFADLMSLLMCFFVLLLSFSELDVQKYKQIAGSMKNAFGVQNQVKVMDIPKGTSIIAQEFSPGETRPTPAETINQITADTTKQSLRVGNPEAPDLDAKKLSEEQTKALLEEKLKNLIADTKADADKLREILKKEIDEGKIDIDNEGRAITIRIREKGSFPSGSATLHPDFIPVMVTLRKALKDIAGKIAVEGHTDDVPITGSRFRSNWDLSSSRALSVTHELIEGDELDDDRFMVIGRADTQPFQGNTSPQNRAQNRRVEIVIRQGLDKATATSINDIQKANPDLLNTLNLGDAAVQSLQ
ncbi:flagellar motor protein MotB [Porticoccus hydrocarbonoclasticus]|jgi:chemotaxis protein MotB|uniref:flagellar motor protein MotB n=1 Tax=Porticoccus TaxID=1123967 RepID=UPI002356E9CB|nr:flagellar motor protein MotB [Porticoccus hydrocarbonoclasticus]|tara:strand:- start:4041 stop:5000 length:960 start_codon:yes stop_codon:yes gene_type:complete